MSRAGAARVAAAVAAGALLAASRPPFDLGPLALVALVPLLWAWRGLPPLGVARLAFLSGVVYYALLTPWIWYFGAVAIVPFLIALALYWAAVGAAVGALARVGLRSPWLTAAAWTVGEAVMSRWPVGGFSWGEIGYAFHDLPAARSVAALGGVPLLSFLAVAFNGLVLDAALAARRSGRPGLVRSVVACVAIVVATLTVHVTRLRPREQGALHFALLQGNDVNRDLTRAELDSRYLPESHFELASRLKGRFDLVVFPESSMDADPRYDRYLEDELVGVAQRLDSAVLANAVADAPDGRRLNLDLLYGPDGRIEGTYAKRHLVPYGEWVPLRDHLGWIKELEQIPRDFAPGKRPGLFDVAGVRIGTVICFESAFGPQVRDLVDRGAGMIVVSTNNRSYRRSANTAQHVAISQMRAAETARPVLHAAISGITAVIDADGELVSTTPMFERTIMTGTLRATSGRTLYVRLGDWAVLGSILALAAASVGAVARRRRGSVDSVAVAAGSAVTPGTPVAPGSDAAPVGRS